MGANNKVLTKLFSFFRVLPRIDLSTDSHPSEGAGSSTFAHLRIHYATSVSHGVNVDETNGINRRKVQIFGQICQENRENCKKRKGARPSGYQAVGIRPSGNQAATKNSATSNIQYRISNISGGATFGPELKSKEPPPYRSLCPLWLRNRRNP